MTWVKVAELGRLPEGEGVLVDVEGDAVALFRIGDSVYAVADLCSHAEASLSEGEVFDTTVECPRHGSEFDLVTGEPASLPATKPVAVYRTDVRDGDVYIEGS